MQELRKRISSKVCSQAVALGVQTGLRASGSPIVWGRDAPEDSSDAALLVSWKRCGEGIMHAPPPMASHPKPQAASAGLPVCQPCGRRAAQQHVS